jgi:hypothetical protein
MSEYPEHDKLRAVQGESQIIGNFLEWINHEAGFAVCEFLERPQTYVPVNLNTEQLLARYLEIDLRVIEIEKRRMLDKLRDANSPPVSAERA